MQNNEITKALIMINAKERWDADYLTTDEIKIGEFVLWAQGQEWWALCKSFGKHNTITYKFGMSLPASDPVWKLVAPILGIETIDPPLA